MQRVIILHTNDIHGRVEGLARIATLVSRIKAENPNAAVVYFDCGDVEEPAQRLSNLTKGAGMHRLLNLASCDAAVSGNGAWMRYGPQVLAEHGATARYPLLLANLRRRNGDLFDGVRETAMAEVGGLRLGLIGLSASFPDLGELFDMQETPAAPLVNDLAARLKAEGADAVLVLSHMGLPADRELAPQVSGAALAILGAHTHDLLPEGELIDGVWVAQTGEYAQYLGRVDLVFDGEPKVAHVTVLPITADIPPATEILAEVERIEAEGQAYLDEVIGYLAEPLDFATDRECGVANLTADALRDRMKTEMAVVAAGQSITGPLDAGPLRRGALWDVCSSTANPARVRLTGEQLRWLVARGLDPLYAGEQPRPLRGAPRGLFHLSGAEVRDGVLLINGEPVDPQRVYSVAGTDWEFEPYGGYTPKEWALQPEYDMPFIVREVVEDYLAGREPVSVTMGRLEIAAG